MSLPENIANTGATAITTIASGKPLKTTETTLHTEAAPPASLQGTGQFRILIGSEILLVTAFGGTGNKEWTVVRKQEGTSEVEHLAGAEVLHDLTAGAVQAIAKIPVVRTITTSEAVTATDERILANNSGAATLTLLKAAKAERVINAISIAAGVLTVKAPSGETIQGKASITVGPAEGTAEYTSVILISDGSNYFIGG